MTHLEFARKLREVGIPAMPCVAGEKRPLKTWKDFQNQLPTDENLTAWFTNSERIGIFTGGYSKRHCLDFDFEAEEWDAFKAKTNLDKYYLETSISQGIHLFLNCSSNIGNRKLASTHRLVPANEVTEEEIEVDGEKKKIYYTTYKRKRLRVLPFKDKFLLSYCTIETRGHAGFCIISPSIGYTVIQGDICDLRPIFEDEYEQLMKFARECSRNEELLVEYRNSFRKPAIRKTSYVPKDERIWKGLTTAEDFATRGRELLIHTFEASGWKWHSPNNREGGDHLTRPGKSVMDGLSNSVFLSGVVHNFSGNAQPFLPDASYSPFHAYALLKHHGDNSQAAKELYQLGFGDRQIGNSVSVESIIVPTIPVNPEIKIDLTPEKKLAIEKVAKYRLEINERMPIPEPQEDFINGLLGPDEKCLLVGGSKSRKSWFLSQMTISLAMGLKFLDINTRKCRIIVYDMEMKPESIKIRYSAIFKSMGLPDFPKEFCENVTINCTRGKPKLHLDEDIEGIIHHAKEFKADIIVFDPLYKFLNLKPPRSLDENKASDMALLLSFFDYIQGMTKTSIVYCTHGAKGFVEEKQILDRASGSGVFARDADVFLSICRHQDENKFVLESVLRDKKHLRSIGMKLEHPLFLHEAELDCNKLLQQKKNIKTSFVDMTDAAKSMEVNKEYSTGELSEHLIKTFNVSMRKAEIIVKTLAKNEFNLNLNVHRKDDGKRIMSIIRRS